MHLLVLVGYVTEKAYFSLYTIRKDYLCNVAMTQRIIWVGDDFWGLLCMCSSN